MMADPGTIERALSLILVSRNLERIADHATNIAEDVIFVVEAKDVRHHHEEREVQSLTQAGASARAPAAGADDRRRVLLIEDDRDIAEAITYQLEKVGAAGEGGAHRRGGAGGRAARARPRAARPQPARAWTGSRCAG